MACNETVLINGSVYGVKQNLVITSNPCFSLQWKIQEACVANIEAIEKEKGEMKDLEICGETAILCDKSRSKVKRDFKNGITINYIDVFGSIPNFLRGAGWHCAMMD